jgi:hypothetical protein
MSSARKNAATAFVDAFARGEWDSTSVIGRLTKEYVQLDIAGEMVSVLICERFVHEAVSAGEGIEGILRRRTALVDVFEHLIEDRNSAPPLSALLMTHLASLYGLTAMKIAAGLKGNEELSKAAAAKLKGSDAYVDELLVVHVQGPTISAGSPASLITMTNASSAEEVDLQSEVEGRYGVSRLG